MIPARKGRLVGGLLSWDAERRLRTSFEAVRVLGLAHLEGALARGPVIVVANHTAWWDPLVAIFLTTGVVRADAYAVMDAANLRKFPFFAGVGAFGVDLDDPADGARALRYAKKLLAEPRRLVWIFPQGREVPLTSRPLAFKGGSAELARLAKGAAVLPIALRYEMGRTPKPTLYVSIGTPLEAPSRDLAEDRARQERAVEAELARIERALLGEPAGEPVAQVLGRTAPDAPGLMTRLLARLTAPREGNERRLPSHDSTSK